MIRVVDTSAWIEWFEDSLLADRIAAELPPMDSCLVPTIVQLELAKWLARELPADHASTALYYVSRCRVIVLDSEIALLAAKLSASAHLPTADAIIYATAIHLSAELLTCDAHFQNLPQVLYFPKRQN